MRCELVTSSIRLQHQNLDVIITSVYGIKLVKTINFNQCTIKYHCPLIMPWVSS